jgi:hypothetical protein
MNLRLLALSLLSSILIFSSCGDDDDPIFRAPSVTAPAGVFSVENGATGQSIVFNVSIDPGLTATYQATGTGVTVINGSGAVSGSTVTVNFDAGTIAGAASINLKVTDSEGQTGEATAVINIGENESVVVLTSNVTSNTTWTSDKVYVLAGRITVVSGVTLTIQAGTIIKGQAGTGANATALLVARGAKLMAEGSADAPIIFTSVADEITPEDVAAGNFSSPNLDPDVNGLWGGVIVLGKARISASNVNGDVSEVQIEGIPTSDPNGLYGGTDDNDDSGVLKYISIRHGGTNIGAGNEINGLTLGGVGSGTVIENIEIVANQDDGIEWFGGSVSVKNVVVWNTGDDAIDTDQSWSGTLDNFIIIAPGDHCFELDGPEGSYEAGHTIQNGTVVANNFDLGRFSSDLINVDQNSIVALKNIYFTEIADGQKINRVTAPGVTFEGIQLDVPEVDLPNYVNGDVPAGVTAGGSSQADASVFGWTWASKAGALSGL